VKYGVLEMKKKSLVIFWALKPCRLVELKMETIYFSEAVMST
jgi:hypothetical protein